MPHIMLAAMKFSGTTYFMWKQKNRFLGRYRYPPKITAVSCPSPLLLPHCRHSLDMVQEEVPRCSLLPSSRSKPSVCIMSCSLLLLWSPLMISVGGWGQCAHVPAITLGSRCVCERLRLSAIAPPPPGALSSPPLSHVSSLRQGPCFYTQDTVTTWIILYKLIKLVHCTHVLL